MSEMLHRVLGEAIKVGTHLAADSWNIQADRNQLENVLLDLAINARDAMHGSGMLTIVANNVTLDDTQADARDQLTPGDYLAFSVTDTGVGMPSKVVEHIFEPLFATKPDGHGMGPGLSMVSGLVKQSGGHIAIDSTVGQGTTAQLYFPRCTEAVLDDAAELCDTIVTLMGGRETVLMVEDDTDVCLTAVDMPTQLGYRVLAAANGQATLDPMNSDMSIDPLFTDVIMPGSIRGSELLTRAAQRVPPLPVLLVSGYPCDEAQHDGKLPPGMTLLGKSYRCGDLARMIHNVLTASRTAQAQAQLTSSSAGPAAATDASQPPVVLLVEDNTALREAMQEVLTTFGLQCMAAVDAEDALALARTCSVQVLLTDLTLPGQSGASLACTLLRMQPQLQVLLISDYGTEAEIGEPIVGARLLGKPIDLMTPQQALTPWFGATVRAADTQNAMNTVQPKHPVTNDLVRPSREHHPRTTRLP